MLVTLWILAGVFGIISLGLFWKFIIASLNAIEVVLFVVSVIIFALAAGMLFDGVGTYGGVIDVGQ